VTLAGGLTLACGLTLVSGLGSPLPVTSGAIPDVPAAGVTPPDDVGVGEGVGSPEGVGSSDVPGGVDRPLCPEAGGLDDPPGDPDPTLGLGEALGVRVGLCGFAGGEDGTAETGGGGAGAEVGTCNAPLELAAAGEAVGGVGPLVHDDAELVEAVVWVLAGLPEFPPL
jgi:hypothetical protein